MASVIGHRQEMPLQTIQRRRIIVQGIVQGVGFRPFVYGQALRWSLVGFVLNDSNGVTIEVEGSTEALDGFQHALREEIPPLARIDSIATELVPALHDTVLTLETGGITILSLTAPTVVRASQLSRMSPMTVTRQPCASSQCAQPARQSMTIP